jgi:3-dehydrotetronate 4-kinase
MLLGVIADDFTGASDIANVLASGAAAGEGLRTVQFLGAPTEPATEACEAGIVSLKSRSIPAAEAIRESVEAFHWLRRQGCRQFFFKYCSTFDSTPQGNIGPVAEALADALSERGVVACPASPALGRSVYQGHLFVFDRLLSESGLQDHPVNPMTDPDIRRWLARQTRDPVGLVPWPVVREGAAAIRKALDEAAGRGETLAIVDAIAESDLLAIAEACTDRQLLTGGSGLALGLPANFIRRGLAPGRTTEPVGVRGPAAILAGSCSRATRAQVAAHAERHPVMHVDVEQLLAGHITAADAGTFVRSHAERVAMIASSQPPEAVKALQARHGVARVARALETFFGEVARLVVANGVRRLVVAGGETAGAVVSALHLRALTIGPEIEPGVPALLAEREGLALALKSGNFGSPHFLDKAVAALGSDR